MKKGTIVLTKFPFTDLSSSKRRSAVVVSKVDVNKKDVIVAFISSVIPSLSSETDLIINKTDLDFKNTGLKKKSILKIDKLATLEKTIFSGEFGEVSNKMIEKINMKLMISLDLNKTKNTQ